MNPWQIFHEESFVGQITIIKISAFIGMEKIIFGKMIKNIVLMSTEKVLSINFNKDIVALQLTLLTTYQLYNFFL